jgi:WD40 repeat protein
VNDKIRPMMGKEPQEIKTEGGAFVSGDLVIDRGSLFIGRDLVIILEHALSIAEQAEQSRESELKRLADGIGAYVTGLQEIAARKDVDTGGPYKELLAYSLSDTAIFFGRDRDASEVMRRLQRGQLTILQSASGAGKTSLLQAGVSPRLIKSRHLPVTVRPYNLSPTLAVKRTLLPDLTTAPKLAGTSLRNFLRQVCTVLGSETMLCIFLDQFEEFFVHLDEAERSLFINELAECLEDPSLNVKWVLSLREDYFGRIFAFEDRLRSHLSNQYRLESFSRLEAVEAITQPVGLKGISFEEGLVDAILDDLGANEIAPPQVQLVCSALYDNRRQDVAVITSESYQAEGRAEAILRGYLERVLSRYVPVAHRATAHRVLEALVTSDSQRAVRSRSELLAELQLYGVEVGAFNSVLNQLTNSRLLRERESSVDNEIAYELVHDYLLNEIRLAPEVQARKATQELLEQEVRTHRRYPKSWITEERLRSIEQHQAQLVFSQEARELFEGSQLALQRAWKKESRRRRILFIGATVTAVIMTLLAALSANRAFIANQREQLARSRELAAVALDERDIDPERGLLIAIEAQKTADTYESQDALRQLLLASRLRLTLQGHESAINSVQYSPDGKQILTTANGEGPIRVWDATTGKVLLILGDREHGVSMAQYSPDGTQFVTPGHDGIAQLWNSKTGKELMILRGHDQDIRIVQFSPNGKQLVTVGYDATFEATLRVWNTTTGEEVAVLRGHERTINSVQYSPDGMQVVTASDDGTARVWDLATFQELAILRGHGSMVHSAWYSPDGQQIVTASQDKTARVWDVASGKEILILRGHEDVVHNARYSPNAKQIVTASEDHTARVWDATTGEELAVLRGHETGVFDAQYSPDGKQIATASYDHTVRLWNAATREELVALRGHSAWLTAMQYSPDGRQIATGSADQLVRVWDAMGEGEVTALYRHEDFVHSAQYSPDGKQIVTTSADDTARLWDAITGQELGVIARYGYDIGSAQFSPDGAQIVTSGCEKIQGSSSVEEGALCLDAIARVWNVKARKEVAVLRGHKTWINDVEYSPDGKQIVTASSDGTARVWDSVTGQLRVALYGHTDSVQNARFSPNGKQIVTASYDETARVWDVATGDGLTVLSGHTWVVWSAQYSPDGKQIATTSLDGSARIWDATTGKERFVLLGHDSQVFHAQYSPDGTRLVTTGNDGTARVWDLTTGREILRFNGYEHAVDRAYYAPDGKELVVVYSDKVAKIWDATTGQQVAALRGAKDWVRSAEYSPDGRFIVTTSSDKTSRVYLVHIEELINLAYSRVTRQLTCQERIQYLHEERLCPTPVS